MSEQDPFIRQLREQISDTDRSIVEAINSRLKLVARLKSYKESRGIYVDAREETPSLGEPGTARVTYVYRLLSMPGKAKPVYVKLQGR